MADLKISQFSNGGAIQDTDEIATNRAGTNTKVFVGTMAAVDLTDFLTDAYAMSNKTITSSTINSSVIGGITPAAGTFTTLSGDNDINWFGTNGGIQYLESSGYWNIAANGSNEIEVTTSGIFTTGAFDINGALTTDARAIRVAIKTSAGDQTVGSSTELQIINKSVGAATQVTLPATPATGRRVSVKDGKGDANSNNITIVPSAGTIDGAGNDVINTAYGFREYVYNGTQWNRTV